MFWVFPAASRGEVELALHALSKATCRHCGECAEVPVATHRLLECRSTRIVQLENQPRRLRKRP